MCEEKENKLIEIVRSAKDIDDWVLEMFADYLDKEFPTIFDRKRFFERCKK